MAKRKDLLGLWNLVSHESQSDSGEFRQTGPGAWGSLYYSAEGFLSVAINWKVSEEEKAQGKRAFLFYSGSFDFDEGRQVVVHQVKNSSEEWRIGKNLDRSVRLKDGELWLEGLATGGKGRIRWSR